MSAINDNEQNLKLILDDDDKEDLFCRQLQ